MLVILTTHPIQYQTPLWQALARDGRVSFEVWYLTNHGVQASHDPQFGKSFAWDIDTLAGYPHQFLDVAEGAAPSSFMKCRLREPLRERLRHAGATALWIQGWQVAAYWQAVREAEAAEVEVWLRGESNDLAPPGPWWRRAIKRQMLGWLFARVDRFLYIGAANKRLYERYGIPEHQLIAAPYAVDNDRFAQQADELRPRRAELRRAWNIPDDAFCLLFCGKFIAKKRPLDLVAAARLLRADGRLTNIHLLFVGSGELGGELRRACRVMFDADGSGRRAAQDAGGDGPPASFAGFLNQRDISRAYVAADCLVLPSDHRETWGLVANEALAGGLPCAVSDQCGCHEDLCRAAVGCAAFRAGDPANLAETVLGLRDVSPGRAGGRGFAAAFSIQRTVDAVAAIAPSKLRAFISAGIAASPCL